jgi:hypothetical protein
MPSSTTHQAVDRLILEVAASFERLDRHPADGDPVLVTIEALLRQAEVYPRLAGEPLRLTGDPARSLRGVIGRLLVARMFQRDDAQAMAHAVRRAFTEELTHAGGR